MNVDEIIDYVREIAEKAGVTDTHLLESLRDLAHTISEQDTARILADLVWKWSDKIADAVYSGKYGTEILGKREQAAEFFDRTLGTQVKKGLDRARRAITGLSLSYLSGDKYAKIAALNFLGLPGPKEWRIIKEYEAQEGERLSRLTPPNLYTTLNLTYETRPYSRKSLAKFYGGLLVLHARINEPDATLEDLVRIGRKLCKLLNDATNHDVSIGSAVRSQYHQPTKRIIGTTLTNAVAARTALKCLLDDQTHPLEWLTDHATQHLEPVPPTTEWEEQLAEQLHEIGLPPVKSLVRLISNDHLKSHYRHQIIQVG